VENPFYQTRLWQSNFKIPETNIILYLLPVKVKIFKLVSSKSVLQSYVINIERALFGII